MTNQIKINGCKNDVQINAIYNSIINHNTKIFESHDYKEEPKHYIVYNQRNLKLLSDVDIIPACVQKIHRDCAQEIKAMLKNKVDVEKIELELLTDLLAS